MRFLILMLLAGCASTTYMPYEALQTEFQGQGGTRETINGVDFWYNGDPPRRFRVLGVISDVRAGGAIPQGMLKPSVANETKKRGGDAVVYLGGSTSVTGHFSQAYSGTPSTATAISVPVGRTAYRFAVIKYLD
jgi:hypothetical protein